MDNFGTKLSAMDVKITTVLEKCLQILDAVMMTVPQYREPSSQTVLFNSATSSKEVSLSRPVEGVTESSQIIRLNREDSHPDGRVPRNWHWLFWRHCSQGRGKHKKKQLDPLLIFGIYCHLRYKYGIQERDWVRIKNNMDAKCRFFWSRRNKGFPLGGTSRRMDHFKQEEEEEEEEETSKEEEGVGEPSYLLQSVWDGHGTLVAVEEGQEEVYELDTQNLVLGEELMMSGTVMVTTHSQHTGSVLLSEVVHRASERDEDGPAA